jgi:hypothetical protein
MFKMHLVHIKLILQTDCLTMHGTYNVKMLRLFSEQNMFP